MRRPDQSRPLRSGDFKKKPRPSKPVASASGGRKGGGNHQPPRLPAKSSHPPRKPSLTTTFNKASKGPQKPPSKTYDKQIADLKKLMSQPKPVRNLTPRGADSNKINSKRDKEIRKNIDQIKSAVAKQRKKLKQDFTKAAIKGTAKQSFNRNARRR
jgi:hypothetical protein